MAVEAYDVNAARLKGAANFASAELAQLRHAHDFQSARRGTGARADKHQYERQHARALRPEIEVGRRIAGGRYDRAHLKAAIAQRRPERAILRQHEQCHQQDRSAAYGQIPPELLIAEGLAPFAVGDMIEHHKVHAEEEHEHGDDHVHSHAVKAADARGVIAEAARARRAHGVYGRVVGRHAGEHQRDELYERHRAVDRIEYARRIAHLGHDLAQAGARAFGAHQMRRAAGHLRNERQREHQHAHAADPVGKAAPEHHAVARRVEVGQHSRAGGRKAGGRFKQRVGKIGQHAAEHKRHRAEHAQQNPRKRHHSEALPRAQIPIDRLDQPPQRQADDQRQRDALEHRQKIAVAIEQRQQRRRNHSQRLDHQYDTQQAQYKPFVHGYITLLRSPMPLSQTMTITLSPFSMWSLPNGTMTLPRRTMTAISELGRRVSFLSGMLI